MSGKIIREQTLNQEDHLSTINHYQSTQITKNQIVTTDIMELISGNNGADSLTISETWRGIVEDLYGM